VPRRNFTICGYEAVNAKSFYVLKIMHYENIEIETKSIFLHITFFVNN